MTAFPDGGKLYRLFTIGAHRSRSRACSRQGEARMIGLALAMFIAMFGFGARYFGWDDPDGKVQLALFTAFILGAVCGFKSKG